MKRKRSAIYRYRRLIVLIAIILFVIIGSVLITRKPKNTGKKDLELKGPESFAKETTVTNPNNVITQSEEVNTNSNTTNNLNTSNNNTTSNSTSSSSNSKGQLPVANPNGQQLCRDAQSSDQKIIYLTFDDGPSNNVTPQVLEILERYNVPATFFVLGTRAEMYPELIKQEYEAGHYIANHGWSHTYSTIYASSQSVINEYNKAESQIQIALGIPDFHSYLFRFPGGSSGGPYNDIKAEAKRELENMGIASTNWNCLTGDAEGGKRTTDQLLSRLEETSAGYTSLVVLMHDTDDKQTTADALPSIIEHYQNLGYEFRNYYDIFSDNPVSYE